MPSAINRRSAITEQDILALEERFWSRVDYTTTPDGCWLWTGGTMNKGYGRLIVRPGLHILTHRLSWMLFHGLIPSSVQVCHTCDVHLCVRPEHLFPGTQTINNADRHAKGRSKGPKGETHPLAKLTAEDVFAIRRMFVRHSRTFGGVQLGLKFGISCNTVYNIVSGVTWTHI